MEDILNESLFQICIWIVLISLILDFCFGDPVYKYHPIRLLGRLLEISEGYLRALGLSGRFGGFLLFVGLASYTLLSYVLIRYLFEQIHPWAAHAFDAFVGFSLIAFKDLCVHGLKIGRATERADLTEARHWCSWLIGRDVERMDGHACNRAAIESMSENLVDGILSPLFYFILLGPFGLIVFKVASTMDSMVGYKNERYLYFGWFGARFDDLLNYIPARLSWLLITFVSFLIPGNSGKKAFRIGLKQHALVPGPNAGWSEAACAGALQVRLVGPIWLKGKLVTDLWLGQEDDNEKLELKDIKRSIQLNFWVTLLFVLVISVLKFLIF